MSVAKSSVLWYNSIVICAENNYTGGAKMDSKNILFDDWTTRCDGALKFRKRQYVVGMICTSLLMLVSLIGIFFELGMLVLLFISLIVFANVYLEWLKIKNSHLIIKSNQIMVTNKFNKTTVYNIDLNNLVVKLSHSFNLRSGGIVMKFYDMNNNFICKYEDMLNFAAPLGEKNTNWAEAILNLKIKIIDDFEIIKNK